MKKSFKKKEIKKIDHDIQKLKHWKNISTKSKLEWLESALRFGKLRKF